MSNPLKLGSSGPDVQALQQALAAAGFNPNGVDGNFGPGTQAAVIAFQTSKQLTPDGIAGPATIAALGLPAPPVLPSAIPGVTVAIVSQMFPVTPVANIAANLPPVLNALVTANLADKAMVLMALGTIRAETESFRPISEGQSQFNTSPGGTPFNLYDNKADLGNQGPPDGANFCGRGFVQLTGRNNYTHYGKEIGQDLVDNPALANQPAIAAQLLACFLSDREGAIRAALAANNLAAARKLVNGGSNGLDRFTSAFQIGTNLIP
jgi:peptidoglycan L-alanyl-D-glutamate endopeptidase CwlK